MLSLLTVWSDCARHFRNGAFANMVVRELGCGPALAEECACRFFTENHGKGRIDTHFAEIGRSVRSAKVVWGKDTALEKVKSLIEKESGDYRAMAHVVDHDPVVATAAKLCVDNISCVHDIRSSNGAIYVEGVKVKETVKLALGDADPPSKHRPTKPSVEKCCSAVGKKFKVLKRLRESVAGEQRVGRRWRVYRGLLFCVFTVCVVCFS